MFRAFRRAALAALTCGAAVAAQLALTAPAQAAGPTVTIAATSAFAPVTGYVWVAYRGGSQASARIHGVIAGAAAGEVATLYAQPFPYAKAPAPTGSVTLHAGGADGYSFKVTPTLATRYTVRLFADKTAARPLAASPVRSVYVGSGGTYTGGSLCPVEPVCRVTFHVFVIVPDSALRTEMSKRLYPYFGINYWTGSAESTPKWLYLDGGHASLTAARQISAGEFERTLTFSFSERNGDYAWGWNVCLQDTLAKDGIGLPGHHGCGASRVPATASYLG
jgi:hypothetical protein